MKNNKKWFYAFGTIIVLGVLVILSQQQGGLLKGDFSHIISTIPLSNRVTVDMKDVIPVSGVVLQNMIKDALKNIPAKDKLDSEAINEIIESKGMPFPTVSTSAAAAIQKKPDIFRQIYGSMWTHLGIQGSGVIYAMDYDANNSSHLLMATREHLYQTYDFGSTWNLLDVPANNMQKVAIDPHNSIHYLVLAGENSLFESKNAGKTWNLIYKLDQQNGGAFSLYWSNNNIDVRSGMIRLVSSDNGNTWQKNAIPQMFQYDRYRLHPNGFGLLATDNELYKTDNFGQTWNKVLTLQGNLAHFERYSNMTTYDISADGQFILAAWKNSNGNLNFSQSKDGGKIWKSYVSADLASFSGVLGLQDLLIDPQNSKHVLAFMYMGGLYESFDQGVTFSQTQIKSYENITVLSSRKYINNNYLIIPLDLKFENLKQISVNGKSIYLIATDQGFYAYDAQLHKLINLASSLYMAETLGQIGITSCPMIYSGFMHVGNFIIKPDGTLVGETGETDYASVGPDDGCNTAVMNGGVPYHGDIGQDYLNYFRDTNEAPKFYNGYWYAIFRDDVKKQYNLMRYDQDFKNSQILSAPTKNQMVFYINQEMNKPTYWIMELASGAIWKSTDLQTWTLKNGSPSNSNYGDCLSNQCQVLFADNSTLIWGNLHYPNGFYVSQNEGATQILLFPHMRTSNIVEDSLGRIFIGLYPEGDKDADNLNMNGVWYSTDHGSTWNRFGTGTEKSMVTGLTIDNFTNTLYASTFDESIMKIFLGPKLKIPTSPNPIKQFNKVQQLYPKKYEK